MTYLVKEAYVRSFFYESTEDFVLLNKNCIFQTSPIFNFPSGAKWEQSWKVLACTIILVELSVLQFDNWLSKKKHSQCTLANPYRCNLGNICNITGRRGALYASVKTFLCQVETLSGCWHELYVVRCLVSVIASILDIIIDDPIHIA